MRAAFCYIQQSNSVTISTDGQSVVSMLVFLLFYQAYLSCSLYFCPPSDGKITADGNPLNPAIYCTQTSSSQHVSCMLILGLLIICALMVDSTYYHYPYHCDYHYYQRLTTNKIKICLCLVWFTNHQQSKLPIYIAFKWFETV